MNFLPIDPFWIEFLYGKLSQEGELRGDSNSIQKVSETGILED
jgi:hypothetical protein